MAPDASVESHRPKLVAAFALFVAYSVQTYDAVVHCHSSPLGLWALATIALVPAFGFLVAGRHLASVAATAAIIPFFVSANYQECVKPYEGGGAAVAYVLVFLFGMPLSLGVGLFTILAARVGHSLAARK